MWEMRAELASPMVLAAHGHLHARRRERAQLRVMSARLKVLVRELHREGERDAWPHAQRQPERLDRLKEWMVEFMRLG